MYVWRILLSSSSERSEQHSATKQRRQTPDTPLFTIVMHQSVHRGCTHRLLVHILLKSLMMTCSIGEPESRSAEALGIYYYDHTVMTHMCLRGPFAYDSQFCWGHGLMTPKILWLPSDFHAKAYDSQNNSLWLPKILMTPKISLWLPKNPYDSQSFGHSDECFSQGYKPDLDE